MYTKAFISNSARIQIKVNSELPFFFSFSSCNERSTRRSNGVSAHVASSATGVLRGQMAFTFGCPASVGGHDLHRDIRRLIHINERDVNVTSEHN